MEDKNHLDIYSNHEGFTFFYPSRQMWNQVSEFFRKSDYIVFLQKDDDRLEKFIFRKLR